MIYLYPIKDTFAIFNDKTSLPKELQEKLIELDVLPDGEGVLRSRGDGVFYYEPYPSYEPVLSDQEVIPEKIEEKLLRMEKQLEEQRNNNLVLMDINMTIYEEVLNLQDRLTNV